MKLASLIYRELQLRLEKVTATQRYIEDFKKQQAEWRRMEREKVEAENRRIIEFAQYQQRKEEDRMAKVREREQAKETLHKMVRDNFPLWAIKYRRVIGIQILCSFFPSGLAL